VSTPPLRLLLVEDHRTLREGIKLLLEAEQDIAVVEEVEGGAEAVKSALASKPDVVLMDVGLVGLDGIEATRQIHTQNGQIAVLVLSASPELHRVRAALDAGAIGYLLKRASGQELRAAVRAAASGTPYFSKEVLHALRERVPRGRRDPATAEDPGSALTAREIEVLQLIASGYSNREIAETLSVSIKTIETHRMHIMEKLDIHEVASLTRYAIRKGLVGL
jgi:DNA-binding NarL/FixJ family response regulator